MQRISCDTTPRRLFPTAIYYRTATFVDLYNGLSRLKLSAASIVTAEGLPHASSKLDRHLGLLLFLEVRD